MLRKGRQPEPHITDLDAYPRKWVRLCVAAEYLEIDIRTLDAWIDQGYIAAVPYGKHRRIHVSELKAVHTRHQR
jgi:excisionase family DNA binding protein